MRDTVFMGGSYDQWKTASPYDDEVDWVEECEKMAKRVREKPETVKMEEVAELLDYLADYILEET